jgi:acyl-CoA thioester hydrolase
MPHVTVSRFRVRYAETDQMGMAYYANYLIWMEVGRSDFCRECGFSYRDLERDEQAFLAVAEANCRYLAPARYDDEITVETELSRVKNRIVEFTYRILTGTKVLAEGRTVHVIIGSDGKPRTLPERYLNLLKAKVTTAANPTEQF